MESTYYLIGPYPVELVKNVITGEPTIEKLEEAYERGYAAVIDGGRLICFIDEKAL